MAILFEFKNHLDIANLDYKLLKYRLIKVVSHDTSHSSHVT
jgi:hypothetical protein